MIKLNYKLLYLSLIFLAGCGSGFKLIYKGKNAEGFDRLTNNRCELLWTSYKEEGIVEDVYGPPCNTIMRYKQNGK